MRVTPNFRVCSLSLALIAFTSACEDTSTPTALCKAHGRQVCRAQFACCAAGDRGDAVTLFGAVSAGADEAACVAAVDAECDDTGPKVEEAVAEGRMTFAAAQAAACVERTRGAVDRCDPTAFIVLDQQCREAVTGTVANGLQCDDARECLEAGSRCDDGECKRPGSEGDPCNNDLDCQDAQFACRDDVCVALGQLNAPCAADEECVAALACLGGTCSDLPDEGQDCDPFVERGCFPDSYCDDRPDFDGVGVCRIDGGLGENCRDDRECADDAFCDLTQGQPVCASDRGTGGECNDDAECATAFCDLTIGDGICVDEDGDNEVPEPDFTVCRGA